MKIYLAGPEVFERDPIATGASLKALCAKHGAVGLFAMDNALSPSHPPASIAQASFIRAADMSLIHACDAIVANVTPFRGPSVDVGTAYEMGAGAALGKVVVGYSKDQRTYVEKVKEARKVERAEDGFLRDEEGMAVEEFGHEGGETGLVDNLMVACGLERLCRTPEEAIIAALEIFRGGKEGVITLK